jgi:hypothetical protein
MCTGRVDAAWQTQSADHGRTGLERLVITLCVFAKSERVVVDPPILVGLVTLPSTPHFLWITQFPLFTHADEDKSFLSRGRWASSHHPFTAPMWEDLADLKKGKVEGVRGQHYDLVLNGQEIGGGSVRIHDPKLQEYVMKEVLQVRPAVVPIHYTYAHIHRFRRETNSAPE